MASVLFLVALFSAPNLMRGGSLNPFAFGFESSGCVAVFAFIACYSISTSEVLIFTEWIGDWTRPVLVPNLERAPTWIQLSAELGFAAVLFSLPELIIALIGGWLARTLGLTARLEFGITGPAARVSGSMSDHRELAATGSRI